MDSSCFNKQEDFLLPGMVAVLCDEHGVCKTPGCGKIIGGHPPRPTGNIPPHIYLLIPLLFNKLLYTSFLTAPSPVVLFVCFFYIVTKPLFKLIVL
jgi:hypothetical protein